MNLNSEQTRFFHQILTNMRIIAVALINGVIVFAAIVVFVIPGEAENGPLFNTYAALALGGIAMVLSSVLPSLTGRSIKRALVEGKTVELPSQFNVPPEVGIVGNLLWMFQTRMIVGLAILEGAAFYNLIAYMLERRQSSLVMTGLLLIVMLTKFPARIRLEQWLAVELKLIDELRSLKP